MARGSVAVVGAAETSKMGQITEMSELQLQADAALNAMADAGLTAADIDGIATAGKPPDALAQYLGLHRPGLTERSLAAALLCCMYVTHSQQ